MKRRRRRSSTAKVGCALKWRRVAAKVGFKWAPQTLSAHLLRADNECAKRRVEANGQLKTIHQSSDIIGTNERTKKQQASESRSHRNEASITQSRAKIQLTESQVYLKPNSKSTLPQVLFMATCFLWPLLLLTTTVSATANSTTTMITRTMAPTTLASQATITHSAPSTKFEEEVELLRPFTFSPAPPETGTRADTHSSRQQPHAQRTSVGQMEKVSHIYRIRAIPSNGQFSSASIRVIGTGQQSQAGDRLRADAEVRGHHQRPSSSGDDELSSTVEQHQPTETSQHDFRPIFGARANQEQLSKPSSRPRTTANGRTDSGCNQAGTSSQPSKGEENENELLIESGSGGSSVAASSPTLRLTSVNLNRTLAGLQGGASFTQAHAHAHASPSVEVEGDQRQLAAGGGFEIRQQKLAASQRRRLNDSAQRVGRLRGLEGTKQQRQQQQQQTQAQAAQSSGEPSVAESSAIESSARSPSDSILSLIDDYDSKIITNRTKAQLSCDSGEMILRLNFSEPFKGIVYPDHNRLSPCRFFGDGHHNYELRLPLRGCGTRQAAPRVFVNDVIVRFHKTLELEEDEVKTLICRYPPPLAPNPTDESTAGNSSKSGATNEPARSSTSIELESPSQFEFIEPFGVRPFGGKQTADSHLPGSSGSIETQSENLVVAPPSGGQHNQYPAIGSSGNLNANRPTDSSAGSVNGNGNGNVNGDANTFSLDPYGTTQLTSNMNRHRPNEQLPADLFNQRNSIIAGPQDTISSIGNSTFQMSQQNFFERLSSIELLFLISSLMFLVLLAVGLAGSYYCFRRQVRGGRAGERRASAILRAKRHRYASPSSVANRGNAAAAAGALQQQQQHRYLMQHQHQQPQPPQRVQLAGHLAPLSVPSSPESDLSERGLLTNSGPNYIAGQHQQPYYFNRAYVPDATHYAVGPTLPRSSRRHLRYSSSGKTMGADGNPVYGRRGEQPVSYAYAYGGGWQPNQPHLMLASRHKPRAALPANAAATAAAYQTSAHLKRNHHHHRHLNGDESAVLAPGRSLRLKEPSHLAFASAKYALINKPNRAPGGGSSALGASTPHLLQQQQQQQHHQQHFNNYDHFQYEPLSANLYRAKSLSAIQQHTPSLIREQERGRQMVFGNTLGRRQQHRHTPDRRKQAPLPQPKQAGQVVYASHKHEHLLSAGSGDSTDSNSCDEPNNNKPTKQSANWQRNQGQATKMSHDGQAKPTILLKSIEDSYITNYTEIHEREYLKRDSRRPLGLAEWRAAQPTRTRPRSSSSNARKRGMTSDEDERASECESDTDMDEEQRHPSAQTNLRSLTELDVNFARSLLAPSIFGAVNDSRPTEPLSSSRFQLKPAVSLDQLLIGREKGPAHSHSSGSNSDNDRRAASDSATSPAIVPLLSETGQPRGFGSKVDSQQQDVAAGDGQTSHGQVLMMIENVSQQQQQQPQSTSPDLILSPEYDCSRLELSASPASRNSVSYV